MFGVLASSPRCPGGHYTDSERGHASRNVVQQHTGYEEITKTGPDKDKETFKKTGLFNFITFKRNEEHNRRQERRLSEPFVGERLRVHPLGSTPHIDQHSSKSPKNFKIFQSIFSSHSSEQKKSSANKKDKKAKQKKHKHAETTPIPRVTNI